MAASQELLPAEPRSIMTSHLTSASQLPTWPAHHHMQVGLPPSRESMHMYIQRMREHGWDIQALLRRWVRGGMSQSLPCRLQSLWHRVLLGMAGMRCCVDGYDRAYLCSLAAYQGVSKATQQQQQHECCNHALCRFDETGVELPDEIRGERV